MRQVLIFIIIFFCADASAQSAFNQLAAQHQYVSPDWFGANANDTVNDLPALQQATAYAIAKRIPVIKLSNGVYRINDRWVVGASTPLAEYEYYNSSMNINSASTYSLNNYLLGRYSQPLTIKGSGNTVIHANFNTDTFKSAIYFFVPGPKGSNYNQSGAQANSISDITIFAKDKITGNNRIDINSGYNGNKQVGIFVFFSECVRVENVTTQGFAHGLINNTSYFSNITNYKANYCDTGISLYGSASSIITNLKANYCNTGAVIACARTLVNNYGAEHNKVALEVRASDNIFNGLYLENAFNKGDGQVIIGHPSGAAVTNILFNGLTVAQATVSNLGSAIVMRPNAGIVTIIGGRLQSCKIELRDEVKNKIYTLGTMTTNQPQFTKIF